jgi:peptidoglycan/xylan/chitin deacetylase (PgdA/CDA1 family)
MVVVSVAVSVIAMVATSGNLLGRAAATPSRPASVAERIIEPTAAPSPGTVHAAVAPPANHALGLAPPAPRLLAGSGPFGAIGRTSLAGVALTFDDGPEPTWTPQMLAALRQFNVKATFCLIGENVVEHPDIVRAIVADGHTLCNHSWNHNTALGSLGVDAIRADLGRTTDAIRAAVPDVPVVYFRQPGGMWTQTVVSVAKEMGMASLHWEVDTNDWTIPPVTTLVTEVTAGCTDGAVVLMHDGGGNRANTVAAVMRFLPTLTRTHHFVALPTGDA